MSHLELATHVGNKIATLSRFIGPQMAAEIDVMLKLAVSSSGPYDFPRVVLCELAILTRNDLTHRHLDAIRLARTAHPATTAGIIDCPSIGGIPVKSDFKSDIAKPTEDTRSTTTAKKECWTCGKPGYGKDHKCVDADILLYAKSKTHHRGSKN